MSALAEIERRIEELLSQPPYGVDPQHRRRVLLALLKEELAYACERNPRFRNFVQHWPVDYRVAESIADLPYLPVAIFKTEQPLSLVNVEQITRTLSSSATTGQMPSRIALDATTARRMTKGIVTIMRDFIGPARRPYLVIDTPDNLAAHSELGARGAAVQGLRSFATEMVCCLRASSDGNSSLDLETLLAFAEKWKHAEVLVYGFTYAIWTQLAQSLQTQNVCLGMPNVRVLHSGGWKRLTERAVTREVFNRGVAAVFGCTTDRIIDYYGMVENVGVVYPDCAYGNKHVPSFAEVIVRDPLTLAPVHPGRQGLIQVSSTLPTSFPGFLLLTEDLAQIISYDGCPCGRRGTSFRFVGRAPKAEVRGCGNLETVQLRQRQTCGAL